MNLRPTGPIFGLTLRGMLVITALLAVGVAFVGRKVQRARHEQRIADQIARSGGSVTRVIYGMDAKQGVRRTWFERLIGLDLEARISSVDLSGPEITDAQLAALAPLDGLVQLALSNTSIDGTGFLALVGLPKLISVELADSDSCQLTDEGLAALASLPRLKYLTLNLPVGKPPRSAARAPVTAEGFKQLNRIKSLTGLQLRGGQIDDDLLSQLAGLARIDYLLLKDTSVSDAGLAVIANTVNSIKLLGAFGSSLTGEGAVHLQNCRNLTDLTIRGSPITDAGLAAIGQLHNLQSLDIDVGPNVTPDGVRHVGNLTNLTNLQLRRLRFSDEATSCLSGLTQLNTLSLDAKYARFSASALPPLEPLKQLKSVQLSPGKLSQAAINELQKSLPELTITQ